MELVCCDKNMLNEHGLILLPWIIQDPENTRYTMNVSEQLLIKSENHIVGFMIQRRLKGDKVCLDYLAFDPLVGTKPIREFCQKYLSEGVKFITTYNKYFQRSIWEKMRFRIYLGRQFMKCAVDHILNQGFCHLDIQRLNWPDRFDEIIPAYQLCFPEEEWGHLENFCRDPFARKATIFVVREASSVIGFWISTIYREGECFLCWLGVIPMLWGKGVASQILYFGSKLASESGCTDISLLVDPLNSRAVRFYKKHGFVKLWQRVHLLR